MEKFLLKFKRLNGAKEFILDLLFPKYCFSCGREGNYLCEDCSALIEINPFQYCPFCKMPQRVLDGKTCERHKRQKKLTGVFSAAPYENILVKKLISKFKYEPFVKELSQSLASLIITHFLILGYNRQSLKEKFSGFLLVPVPLYKKRIRWRGFNQAEEIAKKLAGDLEILVANDCLIRHRNTIPQIELSGKEREENVKRAFFCQNRNLIKKRKILLVDDVFTTGSTMEECARVLKSAGAKEVWGVAVARG